MSLVSILEKIDCIITAPHYMHPYSLPASATLKVAIKCNVFGHGCQYMCSITRFPQSAVREIWQNMAHDEYVIFLETWCLGIFKAPFMTFSTNLLDYGVLNHSGCHWGKIRGWVCVENIVHLHNSLSSNWEFVWEPGNHDCLQNINPMKHSG